MHSNGMVAQVILSSHAALIHGIRAQGLTPEYRRTATSTGNILVKANPCGNINEKLFTLLSYFLFANDDLNKGDAYGSDKLLKSIAVVRYAYSIKGYKW
jgi:hypothetical protein